MYECYRDGIADGRESFPGRWIAGENLLYLAIWSVAGFVLWPAQAGGVPVATLGWIAFVLALQILLKKHFCSGCYYYGKACHLGWGKVAAKLFQKDSGSQKVGFALAVPMYMLSPPLVLVAGIVIGAAGTVGAAHWVAVGLFVALNAVSFPLRVMGCRECKMRNVCPGSAVKPKGFVA